MDNKNAYDTLCKKLEPYVISALKDVPVNEAPDYKAEIEQLDEATRKFVEDCNPTMLDTPYQDYLKMVRIKVTTEFIAASWSEALRWTYKEQGEVDLRDYLLPDDLGRARESWNSNISRSGLSEELMENILKEFGKKEIIDGIELPWGGYVRRVGDDFELQGQSIK